MTNKALNVVKTIETFNSIPMRGCFGVIYENTRFENKGLIKLTTFKLMKVEGLKTGKSGAFMFQAFVIAKGDSIYLCKGQQVSCQEWYAHAGIEATNEEKEGAPLLHFRVDRIQKIS